MNSIRYGKVNNESFHITFVILGICPRDNKDTHGHVDRSETYFKSYSHMGGCPAYVLKQLYDKLDAKSELCWFVGFSKFDMKVYVSTNATFMEEEYIMNHIIRDMNEWTEKTEFPNIQDNVAYVDPQPLILYTDTPKYVSL